MSLKKVLTAGGLTAILALFFGCATIQRENEKEMKHLADYTLAGMILEHQGLQATVAMSPGHLVVERSGSGIPMVGKRDRGVLTDVQTNQRVEVRVTELEMDGGRGIGDYVGLYLFNSKEDFEKAFTGAWNATNAGAILVRSDGHASAEYKVKKISLEIR